MFEAGAISRSIDRSWICPIVFGLEPTDIQGPLARFQATRFNQVEMRQLISNMNTATDAGLSQSDFDAVFAKWWPDLESEINKISNTPAVPKQDPRDSHSLLAETLLLVRRLATEQNDLRETVSQLVATYNPPVTTPSHPTVSLPSSGVRTYHFTNSLVTSMPLSAGNAVTEIFSNTSNNRST
jgi:hypothetical protein